MTLAERLPMATKKRQNVAMNQKSTPTALHHPPDRQRVTVDVAPVVLALLDNFCDVTGQARSAVIAALLATHLPAMHEHASDLKSRAGRLAGAKK